LCVNLLILDFGRYGKLTYDTIRYDIFLLEMTSSLLRTFLLMESHP
jgi:hypothetical protein